MKYILFFLIMCLFSVACNNVSEKTYENSRDKMLERETQNPLEFLSVTHTGKRNLFGQTVVRGVIKSNASVCAYENVRVKMLYYKNDGSLVENHEEVVKGKVAPMGTLNFKAKYFTPKGTERVVLSIMSANAAEEQ